MAKKKKELTPEEKAKIAQENAIKAKERAEIKAQKDAEENIISQIKVLIKNGNDDGACKAAFSETKSVGSKELTEDFLLFFIEKAKASIEAENEKTETDPVQLLADRYFGYYPNENTIFISTDLQPFFKKNDAVNHQRSVDNLKSIHIINRK